MVKVARAAQDVNPVGDLVQAVVLIRESAAALVIDPQQVADLVVGIIIVALSLAPTVG